MPSRTILLFVLVAACGADKAEVTALRQQLAEVQKDVATVQRTLDKLEETLSAVQAELAARARAPALPEAEAPASTLAIADDGALRLDDMPVQASALQTRLCELAKARPGVALRLAASAKVEHARVVQVLDAAKACAIARVAIVAAQ